jgi:hypothetical protein
VLNALPQSGGAASQILVPVGPLPVDPDAIRVPSSAAADLAVREVGQFTSLDFLNSYSWVFIVAFVVTLVATPFVRHLAIAMEIVDKPNEARKQHKFPIAYLGGFAVFLGVMAGIAYSYTIQSGPAATFAPIPVSIVIGIVAITFTGLADDVWGWDPRLKIAGQLVAAAAAWKARHDSPRPGSGRAPVGRCLLLDRHGAHRNLRARRLQRDEPDRRPRRPLLGNRRDHGGRSADHQPDARLGESWR